jgi:hypothetical protein
MTGERIGLPLSEDGNIGDGLIGGTFYSALPPPDKEQPPGPDFAPEQVAFFPLDPA